MKLVDVGTGSYRGEFYARICTHAAKPDGSDRPLCGARGGRVIRVRTCGDPEGPTCRRCARLLGVEPWEE